MEGLDIQNYNFRRGWEWVVSLKNRQHMSASQMLHHALHNAQSNANKLSMWTENEINNNSSIVQSFVNSCYTIVHNTQLQMDMHPDNEMVSPAEYK